PSKVTILGLFIYLTQIGLVITAEDIYCGENCNVTISICNPTYKSVYIYNKNDIKLDFVPDVKDYELYVKYYGKWRFTNFTMETRLGNIPKDRLYVFVFPRRTCKEFLLGVKKEDWQTVKCSLGVGDTELDTLLISPFVCDYETVYYNEGQILPAVVNRSKIVCSDEPINKSCKEVIYPYNTTYYSEVEKSREICRKVGVGAWSSVINYDQNGIGGCNWCGDELICWSKYDGWSDNREEHLKCKALPGESWTPVIIDYANKELVLGEG
ncbi:unnamed protein product, partial [marine sediment metagenome]